MFGVSGSDDLHEPEVVHVVGQLAVARCRIDPQNLDAQVACKSSHFSLPPAGLVPTTGLSEWTYAGYSLTHQMRPNPNSVDQAMVRGVHGTHGCVGRGLPVKDAGWIRSTACSCSFYRKVVGALVVGSCFMWVLGGLKSNGF